MRRIADRINGDQKAKEGNLSRRADGKLDTVAEGMRKAVGTRRPPLASRAKTQSPTSWK